MSFERGTLLYKISASSNPARDMNGDQSSVDFGGGGVGGVPGGRKSPFQLHGFPEEALDSVKEDKWKI